MSRKSAGLWIRGDGAVASRTCAIRLNSAWSQVVRFRSIRGWVLGVVLACGLSSGCVIGPTALRATRTKYNESIQRTTEEQLLLNLVRLKYRDAPFFLEVGSVSAQFTFDESGEISGTINEGPIESRPDVLGLRGKVGYSEKPTITFSPLQGEDFVQRVLAPLTVEQLLALSRSGWSLGRVLRLAVQRINGLDNATAASGPTPDYVPPFADFARMSHLLRELQKQGKIEVRQASRPTELSDPIPVSGVNGANVVEAARAGYRFKLTPDQNAYVLTGQKKVLILRIAKEAAEAPNVGELVKLLGLAGGRHQYEITPGSDEASLAGDPRPRREKLSMETRSLMGILFYLSQGVEVPASHQEAGLVTVTRDTDGATFDWSQVTGDLLQIHSQRMAPRHAAVAIRYRGHWFYIDQTDLSSKSTFALLGQLFALQAGGGTSVAPVLTLPVGG